MTHRILVVEDNKTNQLLDRQVLAKLGYIVDVADNGSDALEVCVHTDFDVILMDVQMPILDGYQTTAKLRQREELTGDSRTPIIGLSARAMDGDRAVALEAGMDDDLTKPMRVDQLRAVLKRWLPAPTDGQGEPKAEPTNAYAPDGAAPR